MDYQAAMARTKTLDLSQSREALALDKKEMARLCGVKYMVYCRWEWHKQPGYIQTRKPPTVALRYIELMLWLDENYPTIMERWIDEHDVLSEPY